MKEVQNLDTPIHNLAQLMHSLRCNCLPAKCTVRPFTLHSHLAYTIFHIQIKQTYLESELDNPSMKKFLEW